MQCDILIRGGTVIDPSQAIQGVCDVAVTGERIVAVQESISDAEAEVIIDARDRLVVPGLIDLHVHAYTHSPFGLDPDWMCADGGVTTMLDAGTAGSNNFAAFVRDGLDRSQTDVVALVNLSCIGLIAANLGELLDRRYADWEGVVRVIRELPERAVGVKIRAGKHIIGDGEQGWANFRDAIRAARESGTWLMVHIGECPMSVPEIAESLQPGDCITHCFKSGSTRVTDDDGRIHPALLEAAQRGIVFDVGHGYGSFHWDVVQAALEQGLEPTTISTDLHTKNIDGPVYDMPTTMSKFLMLGVPLERVIEMSTTVPARVLGRADEIGTLRVGTVADISILQVNQGRFTFTDSYRQTRTGDVLLTAHQTLRRGELLAGSTERRLQQLSQ